MSRCKYCKRPVIWVAKPDGNGWFPPFDMPDGMERMKYQLVWSPTGDWIAVPEDKDKAMEMTVHCCEEREEYLTRPVELPTYDPIPLDDIEDEVIIQEKIIYVDRDMSHSKITKLAYTLRVKCPTCGAPAFEWCCYMDGISAGMEMKTLHPKRGK